MNPTGLPDDSSDIGDEQCHIPVSHSAFDARSRILSRDRILVRFGFAAALNVKPLLQIVHPSVTSIVHAAKSACTINDLDANAVGAFYSWGSSRFSQNSQAADFVKAMPTDRAPAASLSTALCTACI